MKLGFNNSELKESTIITSKNSKGEYTDEFENRNILMVSSTSWTKDEVKTKEKKIKLFCFALICTYELLFKFVNAL